MKLEVIRVIDNDGLVVHPEREPRMSGDEHRKLMHALIRIRMVDERMLRLQRQGRLGFYVSTTGEEATSASIRPSSRSRWARPGGYPSRSAEKKLATASERASRRAR